ncbi:Amidinotransferase-domain-containing protein [Scenedesmus sp. NREL 46B-D3]|nr:Amidinotransferase-domain-containing protein [Scenedesmus sp. NREL 46B-D3]
MHVTINSASSVHAHTQPLQVVAPLGPSAVALAAHTQQPAQRLLVDEYARGSGGSFALQTPATELAAYLNRRSVRVALVPDVAQAFAAAARAGRPETRTTVPNSVAAAAGLRSMQSTNSVLMVAPTAFGFNEQAAQDNSFMHAAEKAQEHSSLTAQVCAEFAELHRQLTDVAGVDVKLFQHHLSHGTPDAVFPNNWFSTHGAGEAAGGVSRPTLVLYPMKCPNRAAERRPEVIQVLRQAGYERVVDMTGHESHDQAYFEGTGVLVLDRVNGVAYVALSERADRGLAEQWVSSLGYKDLVTFNSADCRGKSVYHTNVMMAIGTDVAVVCADSVPDAKERQHLLSKLSSTHEVVQISSAQMDALCGNVLELQGGKGLPVMAMSSQAYHAFTPEQRKVMRRHVAELVHAPIDTLEKVGGGGVRCALAELF